MVDLPMPDSKLQAAEAVHKLAKYVSKHGSSGIQHLFDTSYMAGDFVMVKPLPDGSKVGAAYYPPRLKARLEDVMRLGRYAFPGVFPGATNIFAGKPSGSFWGSQSGSRISLYTRDGDDTTKLNQSSPDFYKLYADRLNFVLNELEGAA